MKRSKDGIGCESLTLRLGMDLKWELNMKHFDAEDEPKWELDRKASIDVEMTRNLV